MRTILYPLRKAVHVIPAQSLYYARVFKVALNEAAVVLYLNR